MDPLADFNPIHNDEHYIDGEHNGGITNSFNHASYSYCYQNPVLYIDPNGKQSMSGWSRGLTPEQTREVTNGWMAAYSSKNVHLMLDGAGTFPVIGEPIDIANGVWYGIEGDYVNAGFSLASAVPILGYASITTKYSIKLIDKSSDLGKIILKGILKNADGTFRADKYRHNLQILTGKLAKGFDAHHTLPKAKQFVEFFKRVGLDVHDPINLIWRESKNHRKLSAEHTKLWQEFMKRFPDADKKTILEQVKIIEKKVWGNTKGTVPIK